MNYTLKDGRMLATRPARPDDAEAMVAYLNRVGGESDNLTFGGNEFRLTVEQERAFIEQVSAQPNTLLLLGLVDGEIAALMNISGMGKARLAHNAGLGISVRGDFWRLGIGERMMREGIAFARETGVLRAIHLEVREGNTGAIALYEKLGFEHVGRHRGEMHIDGVYHDNLLMDLYL